MESGAQGWREVVQCQNDWRMSRRLERRRDSSPPSAAPLLASARLRVRRSEPGLCNVAAVAGPVGPRSSGAPEGLMSGGRLHQPFFFSFCSSAHQLQFRPLGDKTNKRWITHSITVLITGDFCLFLRLLLFTERQMKTPKAESSLKVPDVERFKSVAQ